jgi:hypothetical protein
MLVYLPAFEFVSSAKTTLQFGAQHTSYRRSIQIGSTDIYITVVLHEIRVANYEPNMREAFSSVELE